jgi:glycosyltransferase involved in cell wall biosynthesis
MKSRPLKLALVTRRYPPLVGGAEKVFSYLAMALSAEGAEVTVLTSQPTGLDLVRPGDDRIEPAQKVTHDLKAQPAVKVIRLPTSPLRVWGTVVYMSHLARWFRANTVDLAYVSMLKHDAYAVLGAARQSGFPVVLRPEGAGATGDIAWQSWGNFGRWIGQRCRAADAFVAVSPAIETELQNAWERGTMRPAVLDSLFHRSVAAPRVVMIPNGVPVPKLPWHRRAASLVAPVVVFVGRLAVEKGLHSLVEAWPQVRARHPCASLVLIGEGPERAALEARAKLRGLSVGLGQAVYLPGSVSDATSMLREADLFILPSREEGMSIALLEAMALGMPLVASSIPGNCQLVRDFEHGRLVPPDDPGRLAAIILEQCSNLSRACAMGQAARRRVEQEFSIDIVAQRHIELFEELVAQRLVMKERSC